VLEIVDKTFVHTNLHQVSFFSVSNPVTLDKADIVLIDVYAFASLNKDDLQYYLDIGKKLYIDSTYELQEYMIMQKILSLHYIDKITYFYIPRKDTRLKDLTEQLSSLRMKCVPRQYFIDHATAYKPITNGTLLPKNFLCLTGKLSSERAYLVSLLSKHGLLEYGYVSLFDSNSIDQTFTLTNSVQKIASLSTFSVQAKETITNELGKINLPLVADVSIFTSAISHAKEFNASLYNAVDFVIVPETAGNICQGEFFVTEKTIKCILTNKKFIAVACPFYLKKLKTYCYDKLNLDISPLTDWCDTSYDVITDTEDRIKKIVQIVYHQVMKK
jgi:hypothetical protein